MRVEGHGISVDAPAGWEVRIGQREGGPAPGDRTRPVLHAATVALPSVRGDFGSGVTGELGQQDLFVSLFEYDAEAASTPMFTARGIPAPSADDFRPAALQRSIPGQSGRQYFFQESGRAFCLYVVLGSHASRAALLPRLDRLLRGLVLTSADA